MADYNEAIKNLKTIHGMPLTIRLAIEALEKQIPKKPYLEEDKIWRCSVCNNGLRFKRDVYVPDGQNFCMCCGQAIDWGDE